jgi:D-aminopeptidase
VAVPVGVVTGDGEAADDEEDEAVTVTVAVGRGVGLPPQATSPETPARTTSAAIGSHARRATVLACARFRPIFMSDPLVDADRPW